MHGGNIYIYIYKLWIYSHSFFAIEDLFHNIQRSPHKKSVRVSIHLLCIAKLTGASISLILEKRITSNHKVNFMPEGNEHISQSLQPSPWAKSIFVSNVSSTRHKGIYQWLNSHLGLSKLLSYLILTFQKSYKFLRNIAFLMAQTAEDHRTEKKEMLYEFHAIHMTSQTHKH